MNRREFTMGLGAAGAASVFPVGALPATPAVASFTSFQYQSSVFLAQMEGRCSAQLIVERFGLSPAAAEAVQARMVRKGIVAAPSAAGVCRSTFQSSPATANSPKRQIRISDLKERLEPFGEPEELATGSQDEISATDES